MKKEFLCWLVLQGLISQASVIIPGVAVDYGVDTQCPKRCSQDLSALRSTFGVAAQGNVAP